LALVFGRLADFGSAPRVAILLARSFIVTDYTKTATASTRVARQF
jgi:hypothetical protein